MKMDRVRANYILPKEAEIKSISMGSFGSEGKGSKLYIGTFGLGPCTAIAASITDENNNVYRFCSHIDMGEIVGGSIDHHLNRFRNFLSSIPKIKEINLTLVSSESFLEYRDRTDEEHKLLEGLKNLQKIYGFKIQISHSTVVQISPDGKISTPSKYEIDQNKFKIIRETAIENGYKIDRTTKTPCITDENLGCYLFDITETDLVEELKGKTQEERNQIIKNRILTKSFWSSMIEKGGNVVVGISPLNPDNFAYYLTNYKEVAEKNYGFILYATRAESEENMIVAMGNFMRNMTDLKF